MSASRLQRWLLLAFPPSFRARYGEELETLTSDCGRGWRTNADLAQAAAKAWLRPSFIGPPEETRRRRLESTTATVFVTWSLSCLAVAVFAKAVNDQPVPGLRSWGWTAYVIGSGLFELTVGGALVVGFGYWLRVVVPAWRSGDRRTLLASALPAGIVAVWLGATGLVALYARRYVAVHDHYQTWRLPGHGAGTVLAAYGLLTVACVGGCAISAVRALRRARLGTRELRAAAVMSTGAAASLLVVTAAALVCVIRVLDIGGIDTRNTLLAVIPVAFLVLASVVSTTSSARCCWRPRCLEMSRRRSAVMG
ncbi:MAG TPA: hypothetical protein VMV09_10700, partial [Candidatus Saccharimonadales bacterium]|nr:hypothetical protein [Candidatus Saccharimonadales bacterium]